jgi:hypothetical protein
LVRQPADLGLHIGFARIEGFQRAAASRKLATRGDGIGRYNSYSGSPQQHGKQQPDRSLADNHGCFIRLRRALDYGFQTRVYRFDEARALERNSVRNFFHAPRDDPVHNPHILRETAAGRLKSGSHPDLLVDRALRIKISPAIKTVFARNVVKHYHAIAGRKSIHLLPGAHYHSSGLMSIDAWRGQKVVFDLLQIRVADATSFHAHQYLARADFGDRHLLDGDDTLALVYSRVHGRRDTPVRIGNRQ